MKKSDKLVVYYNNIPKFKLNQHLIDKQDCWENLDAINAEHVNKLKIYDAIKGENNVAALKAYAQNLTDLEFRLQELWKFPKDSKFHRFWDTPKCLCAKLDNSDNYPTGYYSISGDCPLHSREEYFS